MHQSGGVSDSFLSLMSPWPENRKLHPDSKESEPAQIKTDRCVRAARCSVLHIWRGHCCREGGVNGNMQEESAVAVFTLLSASRLRKYLFRRTVKGPGLFLRLFPVIQDCGKDTEPSADRKGRIYNLLQSHLFLIRYSYPLRSA